MLARLMGSRTSAEWVAEYAEGHSHPVNQACHAVGIPLITASIPVFLVALLTGNFWRVALAMFAVGWGFQFLGHAFEGKPPEFFKDPRFLFVGLRWWVGKRLGRL